MGDSRFPDLVCLYFHELKCNNAEKSEPQWPQWLIITELVSTKLSDYQEVPLNRKLSHMGLKKSTKTGNFLRVQIR